MELKNKAYSSHKKREIVNSFDIKKSIVFNNFENRIDYVPSLINRLKCVPQVIPLEIKGKRRNRHDHLKNMIRINELIGLKFFSTINIEFFSYIKRGIEFHDIGHPPFGHAGERELNAILKKINLSFYNSSHSERILTHHIKKSNNYFLNMYNTNPFKGKLFFVKKNEHENNGLITVMIDFIDDLENCFGDLCDLWNIFENIKSKQLFGAIAPNNCSIEDNIVDICIDYISNITSTTSYFDFICAIKEDQNSIHSRLKLIRKEIGDIVRDHSLLVEFDENGQDIVKGLFEKTNNLLLTMDIPKRKAIIDTVDIIASSYL